MTSSAKIVVHNTGVIYLKLLLSILIGFLIVRLLLASLGQENYGIYSLVAGITGMLGFLNVSLSNATMRFMAHSLGTGDMSQISKTFNTSVVLHFLIGVLIVFLMLAGGYFMFKYMLNIPADSYLDAKIIFYFMVLSTFITIISVPYDAVMNAHENFLALSVIEIFALIMHLGVVIYLPYSGYNMLVAYGLLMMLKEIFTRLIKKWYARKNHEECKLMIYSSFDYPLAKQIMSFTGWSFLSTTASIFAIQSRSVLLNMFFGLKLNTANGIAKQLSGKLNMVSVSMTRAINPQVIKSEGGGNRNRMVSLTMTSAKFSFLLLSLVSIPVILETTVLMNIWLKEVPEYLVIIVRLIIINLIFEKFTFAITTSLNAVGRIKEQKVASSLVMILIVPIAYLLFKTGYPPQTIFVLGIISAFAQSAIRLYYGSKYAGIQLLKYLNQVVKKGSIPIILSFVFSAIPVLIMPEGVIRLFVTVIFSLSSSIILIVTLGLTKDEYRKISSILRQKVAKRSL